MFVSWKPSPVLAFLDEHWSDFYLQVPISVSTFCFSGPLLVGFPKYHVFSFHILPPCFAGVHPVVICLEMGT